MNKISEFQREYRFLSNFWPATFVYKIVEWPSAEHAYQAQKTIDGALREEIKKIKSPAKVKSFSRKIELRSDWDIIKLKCMEGIVYAKFSQNPDLKQKLLDTGDMLIEEGNRWRDKFWGISPPNSGDGLNMLGKILMDVRSKLKENNDKL